MTNKKKQSSVGEFFSLILSRLKKREVKQQIFVFFVCFFISLIIWLFIKLSYNYTTTISYPVRFTNLSKDMGLMNKLPKKLDLVVRDKGTQLLKHKFSGFSNEIVIDASQIAIKKTAHGYSSTFLSKHFLNKIAYQTKFDKHLIAVKPDSIILSYEKYVSKKVPITSLISYKIPEEFWLSKPVEIQPKTVNLHAFQSVIDTIKTIYTEKKNLGEIKSLFHQKIALQLPENVKCEIEPDSIEIDISSKRFTEKEIQIPIEVKSTLAEKIKVFPSKVTVTFLVSFDDYANIKMDMFSAMITVKHKAEKSIPVKLVDYPNFIKLKNIEPQEVEIMIVE